MRTMIALASALAAVGSAAAQSAPPSIAMTTRMTVDSGSGPQTIITRMMSRGTRSRTDISVSSMPQAEGVFMVFDASDSSFLEVIPSSKMVMMMKVPALTGELDLPKVTSSGARDTLIDLGTGEPILGFATHHYRRVHSGTSTVTYAKRICTTTSRGATDLWMTEDSVAVSMERESHGAMMQVPGAATASATADRLRQGQDSAPRRRRARGIELRSISVDSIDRGGGNPIVTTRTSETTELSRSPLDSTLFFAPADFRVMDMRGITVSGDMSKVMDGFMNRALQPGCVAK
jgi:hypothetical protein